jgi:CDP-paratose 2-epimerase
MKYLITGGCGFLGSNLASEVLKRGHELVVFDNLSRLGSTSNLAWLRGFGDFSFIHGDIRNTSDVEKLISNMNPEVVFHLAGQVAMTSSLENPRKDFEINVCGTINLLESLRKFSSDTTVIYSSTNKVYGDLDFYNYEETSTRYKVMGYETGFDENIPLDFRSPYGCSKGSADQYMLDYARNFGIKAIVFRHSSIFGGRQFSTFDQGWVGWFIKQALLKKSGHLKSPFTISGTGKQVRDVLFASDLIQCYFLAANNLETCSGQAFNIGGGMQNSLSLLELFEMLERKVDVKLEFDSIPWRSNDQKVFVANIDKAKKFFDWEPIIQKEDGMEEMINWVKNND